MEMGMRLVRSGIVVGFALFAGGCYHAIVDTGLTPSGSVIEDKWADSFVEGIVPPDAVQTAQGCPNGIAKVETRISFLNGLVRVLTWGIYTPMHITVHCAAAGAADQVSGAAVRVPAGATGREIGAAIERAARLSAESEQPAFLILDTE